MASKPAADYRPLTPPLTWAERIADVLVVGVLIFWFTFLGLAPKKIQKLPKKERPASDPAERPTKHPMDDDDHHEPLSGVAAE